MAAELSGGALVNPTVGKKLEGARKPEFEQSLARLEEIVRKLESANLPLDDAMKFFEEGMQLSRDCQKQLEQAEARVEILLKKAGGEMTAQPFEPESDEET
jgi:exodeoxyribonuclease VII small subunit